MKDWDKYEEDERKKHERSLRSLGNVGDICATAAESMAYWNRMYRQLLTETTEHFLLEKRKEKL